MKNKIMIGVSTEQNITNLIPALQNRVNEFILIETSQAKKKNWSNGLISVLNTKDIKTRVVLLNETEDTRIELLSEKLINILEGETNQITWNLGGGQKAQQFALWQTFLFRYFNNIHDKACYSNPSAHNIEWWFWENNTLKFFSEKISVPVSLEEVLTVFGFEIKGSKNIIFKRNSDINTVDKIPDLINFSEFREYLYKLSRFHIKSIKNDISYNLNEIEEIFYNLKKDPSLIQNLIESSLHYMKIDFEKMKETTFKKGTFLVKLIPFLTKQIIEHFFSRIFKGNEKPEASVKNPELKKILSQYIPNPQSIVIDKELLEKLSGSLITKGSLYFEKIVIQRTVDYLNSCENNILEAYQNIKIKKKGTDRDVGEYDILMLTEWGTLISFDSKTFDFEMKDLDARLYNLEQMGGKFVDFIPVFPYYEEDLDSVWKSNLLKELPFKLSEDQKKFFVVTETKDKEYIKKSGTKIKYSDEGIKCMNFSNFLEELGLLNN